MENGYKSPWAEHVIERPTAVSARILRGDYKVVQEPLNPESDWSLGLFREAYARHKKLKNAGSNKEVSNILVGNDSLADEKGTSIDQARSLAVGESEAGLYGFVLRNSPYMVDSIARAGQGLRDELLVKFVLENPIYEITRDPASPGYNDDFSKLAMKINEQKDLIKRIEKTPQEFLKERLEQVGEVHRYLMPFFDPEKVLEEEVELAKYEALMLAFAHNPSRFIAEDLMHMSVRAAMQQKELSGLERRTTESLKEATNGDNKRTILDSHKTSEKAINERHQGAMSIAPVLRDYIMEQTDKYGKDPEPTNKANGNGNRNGNGH